jgi:hypothetical protein
VRYRLMATYDGSPFEAGIGPTAEDIVLFAACPPPEQLGFEPATGHWRKQLRLSDVQAVWESRPVGVFRGERCLVLDDLGDRLHIGYLGHDGFRAEQLGYWQVDRGVFELIAPRTEISDIKEERVELPLPAAAPAAGPAATEPAASYLPPASEPGGYALGPEHPSGPIVGPGFTELAAAAAAVAYPLEQDDRTGVTLPTPVAAPLPLEAEAMRAASASRHFSPHADAATGASRQHRAARRRLATERLFADLASLAGIPADSYSVGEEIAGALCLIQTESGFDVFLSADGARHELQFFSTEEAACFYLFGVLAAEAVRTGVLARVPGRQPRTA